MKIELGPVGLDKWRNLDTSVSELPAAKISSFGRHLMTIAHISDTHVCDSQSPARLPFTDRYGDPHHPYAAEIGGPVGNYRAQEMLTTQVFNAVVQKLNTLTGRYAQQPISLTLITGDVTDNAQINELAWAKKLLQGGFVRPNSGAEKIFEGPGGSPFDSNYWNPEEGELDSPKLFYGYPTIPGLLAAAIDSFEAPGLQMPFIAVHGNHDELLQGTVSVDPELRSLATSDAYPVKLAQDQMFFALAERFAAIGPASWPEPDDLAFTYCTPDSDRAIMPPVEWELAFGNPKHNVVEHQGFVFISLNTVNPFGGWDGSLDRPQLYWLEQTLLQFQDRPVILLSHHPLERMKNDYSPLGSSDRVCAKEFEEFVSRFHNIVAWFAGHEHRNTLSRIGGEHGFWLIETCSLIDWPQEGRVIEFFEDGDDLVMAITMFSHDSPITVLGGKNLAKGFDLSSNSVLASLSRQIAANDWQRQIGYASVENMEGNTNARNLVLRHPKGNLRI